jgi:hypothetical protein
VVRALPSKSDSRKMKSTVPTVKLPQPVPSLSHREYSSNKHEVETETKPPEAKATSSITSLDLYSAFSTELPRISEIRQLHRQGQRIEERLMENRIEQQLLRDEIVQLRNIFDPSKSLVDESYLRLSMVRMSLMQLIDDPDAKDNDPLKVFIGNPKSSGCEADCRCHS